MLQNLNRELDLYIDGEKLEVVDSTKYLGIQIDQDLEGAC